MTELEHSQSRRPIVELLMLAAPTIAQMASYTFMQFADRWLLAGLGDVEATAAGTAGITYFCLIGFGFGTLFIVSTLASQALGRGDLRTTGQYLWQGLWFGLGFGILTLVLLPLSDDLFIAMGHESRVVKAEAEYLRVIMLGGWIKLAAIAATQFLMGIHRPTIVFIATVLGVAIDFVLSWALIYGKGAFPMMGVAGAAWGSNAGVMIELVVMLAYVFRPSMIKVYNTLDWRLRVDEFKTLLRVGMPAGFQLICDITAWTVFMNVILARFGTAALSANAFAFAYMHLCFMPAFGVGSAVTALVGKYIGAKRPDLAMRRAHLGFVVCAIYMVLAGIALYIFRFQLIEIFSKDPEVIRIGGILMGFVAIYQIFDAMFVVYVSALRGAGDTLVPATVQALLVWSIVVGGGTLMVIYAPHWGVYGPWTLASIFGGILGLFLMLRFARGKWKLINLHPVDASNALEESAKLSVVTGP